MKTTLLRLSLWLLEGVWLTGTVDAVQTLVNSVKSSSKGIASGSVVIGNDSVLLSGKSSDGGLESITSLLALGSLSNLWPLDVIGDGAVSRESSEESLSVSAQSSLLSSSESTGAVEGISALDTSQKGLGALLQLGLLVSGENWSLGSWLGGINSLLVSLGGVLLSGGSVLLGQVGFPVVDVLGSAAREDGVLSPSQGVDGSVVLVGSGPVIILENVQLEVSVFEGGDELSGSGLTSFLDIGLGDALSGGLELGSSGSEGGKNGSDLATVGRCVGKETEGALEVSSDGGVSISDVVLKGGSGEHSQDGDAGEKLVVGHCVMFVGLNIVFD